MRLSRILATSASVLTLATCLAACGSDDSDDAATVTTPSAASTTDDAPAYGSPTSAAPAPTTSAPVANNTVIADETEFKIALSQTTLTPGTYTVIAHNRGTIKHSLQFDGPGVEDQGTGDIAPGASKDLTVTLSKGMYDVYCTVGNHKMEGMDVMVMVS